MSQMKLYTVETGVGKYWVIAEDPTTAEKKVIQLLERNDYGFSNERVAKTISVIAEAVDDGFIGGKFLIL